MDVVIARTFLAAAASGSFAAAALRVQASAPTVTERIKQLEHLLGARLFERDKRGCRLTAEGHRFIGPAQNLIRAWDEGCSAVALPVRFERLLRIGGQHALWPSLLIPWLRKVRSEMPEVAIRAIAAAPAQLSLAIESGELDMVFLYDPIRHNGMRIAEIFADRLVLATANPHVTWQQNFARIDWGTNARAKLNARLGELPAPGLEIELGALALDWLVETGSSGFVPERLASRHFESGALVALEGAPSIEFSPFVCWSATLDTGITERLVALAKQGMLKAVPNWPSPDPGRSGLEKVDVDVDPGQ